MFGNSSSSTCRLVCWVLGALIGLGIFLILAKFIYAFVALIIGAACGIGAAFLLVGQVCGAAEQSAEGGREVQMGASQSSPEKVEAPTSEQGADDVVQVADGVVQVADVKSDEGTGVISEPKVTASQKLAGEEELASRHGVWRYSAPSLPQTSSGEEPIVATDDMAPDPHVEIAQDVPDQDFDGDGVVEGADEGVRPTRLDAPREGGADDLKKIKGIGPKLEQLCNGLGFYHFDQISGWSEAEIAWVNANLKGFKGRVSRDDWVEQAKTLAAGGETEFSTRVDKGSVY